MLGFTRDGRPLVGPLPQRGGRVFVGAGFCGHGMPTCFGVGRGLAMMLEASLRPGLNPGAEDGEAEGGEVSAERDREGVAASERVHPFLRGAASVARLWAS